MTKMKTESAADVGLTALYLQHVVSRQKVFSESSVCIVPLLTAVWDDKHVLGALLGKSAEPLRHYLGPADTFVSYLLRSFRNEDLVHRRQSADAIARSLRAQLSKASATSYRLRLDEPDTDHNYIEPMRSRDVFPIVSNQHNLWAAVFVCTNSNKTTTTR